MEQKRNSPENPQQLDLDLSSIEETRAKLVESIRRKRIAGEPLTSQEQAFQDAEREEDKRDLRGTYPH